jgi:cob(I)alamin adenosyltransferase
MRPLPTPRSGVARRPVVKIYTRQGDAGMTVLFDGRRVPKYHPRLEACGGVDELCSHLGLAAVECRHSTLVSGLQALQRRLFDLGADLATPLNSANARKIRRINARDVTALERHIDQAAARLPPLKRFILPGGGITAARLHVARAVCRRAERQLAVLMHDSSDPIGRQPLIFLNRLGDLLFMLARLANQLDGIPDLPWKD